MPGSQAGPRPLRDADNFVGFPWLRGAKAAQAQAANEVYSAAIELLFLAFSTSAIVTIENPTRSWLWPLLTKLIKERGPQSFANWFLQLEDYVFDACVFGAPRQKSARIKGSPSVFQGLYRECDKSHTRLGWQPQKLDGHWYFPTKDEAEYTKDLCQFLCAAAARALCTGMQHSRPAERAAMRLRSAVRTAAAVQTKPEYKCRVPLSHVRPGTAYKLLGPTQGSLSGGPSSEPVKFTRPSNTPVPPIPKRRRQSTADQGCGSGQTVGVYHSMEEHLQLAEALSCPFDTTSRVPDNVRKNLFLVLTEGPVAVSKRRMLALQQVNKRLGELSEREQAARASMEPGVSQVSKGKALELFPSLLKKTGFTDMSVLELMIEGVPLVGEETPSPSFSKRRRPGSLDSVQLSAQSELRRQSLYLTKGLTAKEDLATLKEESHAEVAAGYLLGPFESEEEVSAHLGTHDWSLSPRFVLRQGEEQKVRVIDDFKMSAVNKAFSSSSYLELQDTDYTVGLLRFVSRVLQDPDRVRVPLQDGTTLEGEWSPEMASKPPLLGKTLDLSKAYKQVAVHPDCRKRAVLGFPVEPGKWHYYLSRSLPFGATSSVYAFNKIALALLHIMVVKFYAIATDFYDDYTVFDFQPCAALLDKVLMRLLTLLGWHFAREGKKFVPFASTVVSLGVSIDLSPIWKGAVEVANKPGRLEKISELLRSIAEGSETTRSHLASLHGLRNFAGGYVLGFELKPTARMLAMSLQAPSEEPPKT